VHEKFVEVIFEKKLSLPRPEKIRKKEYYQKALVGGFPEVLNRDSRGRRRAWFEAYMTTILQRDIRNMADIEGLRELPRLLGLLATQTASLLNVSNLSRASGISHSTLKRYLALIEAAFLIHMLPAWSGNVRKRLIKTPKVLFSDSGLLSHLLGIQGDEISGNPSFSGPLLENFVGCELLKQLTWNPVYANLFYYRTANGREVDFVIEDSRGRIVGIEVKGSSSVNTADLKGLKDLAETIGDRFHRGIILYTGGESVPFGKECYALPISALWRLGVE
jgi:uncharacterized protein